MGLGAIRVEVRQDEIIVTEPGPSRASAVFHMPINGTQLRAKVPVRGSIEFKVQAWWLANDRARELGWIA
jgi:hypothetical protein